MKWATDGFVQPDIPSSAIANSPYFQEKYENSLNNLSLQQQGVQKLSEPRKCQKYFSTISILISEPYPPFYLLPFDPETSA